MRSVDYALSRTDVDRSGVDVIGKGAGAAGRFAIVKPEGESNTADQYLRLLG